MFQSVYTKDEFRRLGLLRITCKSCGSGLTQILVHAGIFCLECSAGIINKEDCIELGVFSVERTNDEPKLQSR